jgi:hypothetical protein
MRTANTALYCFEAHAHSPGDYSPVEQAIRKGVGVTQASCSIVTATSPFAGNPPALEPQANFLLGSRRVRSATKHSITEWHNFIANALLCVALLHASAALIHQYLGRDRLLDRMT